ncbi:MAG: hypothetical protein EYC68_08555 [Chloroflexota bacterium]|nr:MAG: hypothetical protein EYC68_08555 [Chloroflexota bacterium]
MIKLNLPSVMNRSVDPANRIYVLILLGWVAMFALACSGNTPKPAETLIFYRTTDGQVRSINPRTKEQEVILTSRKGDSIRYATLSPDLKFIIYGRHTNQGEAVWLSNINGANPIRVNSPYTITGAGWLAQDRIILYGANGFYKRADEGEIKLYDPYTKQIRSLQSSQNLFTCGENTPTTTFGYLSIANEFGSALGHLEVKDKELGFVPDVWLNLSQIPDLRGGFCQSWTQHLEKIIFTGSLDGRLADLYLATERGQRITRLTDFSRNYNQSWVGPFTISPDGNWALSIVHLAESKRRDHPTGSFLVLVDTRTGDLTDLGKFNSEGNIAWSPEGRFAAVGLSAKDPVTDPEKWDLYILDIATKKLEQITFDGKASTVIDWVQVP